tara:strand:- start:389 stop:610 length:222 start_codon:yes stop_codon:yes gene_type:complete
VQAEEAIQYFQEQPQLHQQVVEVVQKMVQEIQIVLEDQEVEEDNHLALQEAETLHLQAQLKERMEVSPTQVIL